jgi:predicted nucleotidyltransferase
MDKHGPAFRPRRQGVRLQFAPQGGKLGSMNATALLARLRSLLELAYGARLKGIVLYGSVARGEANAESDIDVLVVLDQVSDYGKDLRTNIEVLYPLAKEIGRRISAKPVSEQEYQAAGCPLYRNAHREGIFFRRAAAHFDPHAFADALAAVPDLPPAEEDKL